MDRASTLFLIRRPWNCVIVVVQFACQVGQCLVFFRAFRVVFGTVRMRLESYRKGYMFALISQV